MTQWSVRTDGLAEAYQMVLTMFARRRANQAERYARLFPGSVLAEAV